MRGFLRLLSAINTPSAHRTKLSYFAVCQSLGGVGEHRSLKCDCEDSGGDNTATRKWQSPSGNEMSRPPPSIHLIIYFSSDFHTNEALHGFCNHEV